MVTGGRENGHEKYLTSVELLLMNGTRLCALPDLPGARHHHSQSGPLTCGGVSGSHSEYTSCVTFSGGSWQQTHTLGKYRVGHTAWASPRGVLLMGGAYSGRTTELLNDNGSTTASFNLDNERRSVFNTTYIAWSE